MSPSSPRLWLGALLLLPGLAAAQTEAGPPDAGLSPEDQKLLKEIEAATAGPPPGQTAPQPSAPSTAGAPPSAGNRALNLFSNLFNPAMSVNGLLLGSLTSAPDDPNASPAALQLQELELQFLSNVDPYFTANLTLAIPNASGIEVEEGYISSIPQPLGLGVRAGKVRQAFGRENVLHTHALPFIERSLVANDVFGEEGLSEVGLELSWLAPMPWYALLTVAGIDGANDALFGSPRGKDFAGVASLKNVFDVTDDATLEAGVSYALGNNIDVKLAQVLGAHLVFKWKPATNARNRSVVVGLEGLLARKPASVDNPAPPPFETGGFYGYLQVQLHQGWYLAARGEVLGHRSAKSPEDGTVQTDMTLRQSAVLVFAPTEFSAFRLQLSVAEPPGAPIPVFTGLLQVNFTIGAHPAHAY